MLIPTMIALSASAADFEAYYAVYILRDGTETIRYVGMTTLRTLFEFEDARNNSEWINVFARPLAVIDVQVHALTTNEREAIAEQRRLITLHRPHCNVAGYFIATKYQNVMCHETQEVFQNAARAAKAHGIDPTALGHHLKGKAGYKTVKGRTYSYHITPSRKPIG